MGFLDDLSRSANKLAGSINTGLSSSDDAQARRRAEQLFHDYGVLVFRSQTGTALPTDDAETQRVWAELTEIIGRFPQLAQSPLQSVTPPAPVASTPPPPGAGAVPPPPGGAVAPPPMGGAVSPPPAPGGGTVAPPPAPSGGFGVASPPASTSTPASAETIAPPPPPTGPMTAPAPAPGAETIPPPPPPAGGSVPPPSAG